MFSAQSGRRQCVLVAFSYAFLHFYREVGKFVFEFLFAGSMINSLPKTADFGP